MDMDLFGSGLYDDGADAQKGRYLTFTIDREVYAIEIAAISEILSIQPITEYPGLPEYMMGIVNLRGTIVPVMDIRLRIGKNPKAYNDRTCIIVVETNSTKVGLIAESLSEVESIADENISPTPYLQALSGKRYIKGVGRVGQDVKLILDCEELISRQDAELLGQIIQQEESR